MTRALPVALFFLALMSQFQGQLFAMQADQWTAHTSGRKVRALAVAEDIVWAATAGGVFSYEVSSGEIVRYTVTEGMHDVQTGAIAYDARRRVVWTGYVDGVLDALDVESGAVTTYFDIQRSQRFPSPEIHRLALLGDSLLVATSFGLVIFDTERLEVRDTYSQLGGLPAGTAVKDLEIAPLADGRPGIWLAAEGGVAYADLQAVNLQDPNAWAVDTSVRPSRAVEAIAAFDGHIYVGTDRGLGRRDAQRSYTSIGLTSRAITDLAVLPDRLLAIDAFKLYAAFAGGASAVLADGFPDLHAVAVAGDETVWVADAERGISQYERPVGTERPVLRIADVFPEGPFDSPFGDLAVDAEGSLWAAAVETVPGAGFYRLGIDGAWTNYTSRFREELAGRGNFLQVHADAHGSVWAASRGSGLAQVTSDGALSVYDESNSSLLPAAGTTSFVIVGGLGSEEDGTLWVTNTTAARPLHVRTPDGQWTGLLPPSCTGTAATTALGSLLVDSGGLKWILVQDTGNLRFTRGIMVLDTGDTPTDQTDDSCRFFGQPGALGRGLPSVRIHGMAEDRTGRIWIATEEGPAYFLAGIGAATDASLEATWPVWSSREQGSYVLGDLPVTDIAVDPSNRLWLATHQGAYLVGESTGFDLVRRYTTDSSPILSNVVNAIAVDGATGRVYLSTDRGLVAYQGDAIDPVEEARDLFIYPNPVVIAGNSDPDIYIEGLVEETEIRVVTLSGELVGRLAARGGRARWNGRDQDARPVPSGTYLVIAVGQNGEGASFGKVAIIR